MVVVGRNIPVTLLDLEKVTSDSGSTGGARWDRPVFKGLCPRRRCSTSST